MRNALHVAAFILPLLAAACASIASNDTLNDGTPAHNPQLLKQTEFPGIPGFEHLYWGMTEAEIRAAYPDFENAYEGRFNSAMMLDPTAYRMLRISHYKLGECTFQVTLRYFHHIGDRNFDSLRYFEMHLVDGDLIKCREVARTALLASNGPHPSLTYGQTYDAGEQHGIIGMWWAGPFTIVQLYDDNSGPAAPSFDIVYKDITELRVEPIVTGKLGCRSIATGRYFRCAAP